MVAPLVNILPHPELPHLKVAEVAGNQVVVGDHYDEGVLGIFIPDGAIVPDKLLEDMWLKGKLAGKQKNRVKARDREGVYSAGLFYGSGYWYMNPENREIERITSRSWNPEWKEGDDVTEQIGVTFKE